MNHLIVLVFFWSLFGLSISKADSLKCSVEKIDRHSSPPVKTRGEFELDLTQAKEDRIVWDVLTFVTYIKEREEINLNVFQDFGSYYERMAFGIYPVPERKSFRMFLEGNRLGPFRAVSTTVHCERQ